MRLLVDTDAFCKLGTADLLSEAAFQFGVGLGVPPLVRRSLRSRRPVPSKRVLGRRAADGVSQTWAPGPRRGALRARGGGRLNTAHRVPYHFQQLPAVGFPSPTLRLAEHPFPTTGRRTCLHERPL